MVYTARTITSFTPMGDFKKFGKRGDTFTRGPGGKPSFNSRPGFNRGGEPREMFKATCAECGKPCEVPFRPSGERPVYCRDCFQAVGPQNRGDREDRGGHDSRGPSSFPKRDFAPRPFSPTPQQGSGEDKRLDDIKIQLSHITSKLDKLITMLGAAHATPRATSARPETLQDTLAGIKTASAPNKQSAKSKVPQKKHTKKK